MLVRRRHPKCVPSYVHELEISSQLVAKGTALPGTVEIEVCVCVNLSPPVIYSLHHMLTYNFS